MRAERVREELGRQLVVLLVGLLGQRCDGCAVHAVDEPRGHLGGMLGVVRAQLRQPRTQQAPDGAANDPSGTRPCSVQLIA